MSEYNYENFIYEELFLKQDEWKRISENKQGSFDVIVFENSKDGRQTTVIANDKHYPEMQLLDALPRDFWIAINKEDFDMSTIDENLSYFDKNSVLDDGEVDTVQVIFKHPDDSEGEYWYSQEVTYLMENFYGVENYSKVFHESMENCSILQVDKTISEIKKMLESKGLRFIGYENFFEE